jgi:glycerol-3-phosphate dehydrogenase
MNERWKGMYPVAWGETLREGEFTQWIYKAVLGL